MNKFDFIIKEALPEDRDILINLFSLYGHDISEFTKWSEVNSKGLFEFEDVDDFLEDEGLKAFIIFIEDLPVGFLLMGCGDYAMEECDFIIYDLFILRKYRRSGLASGLIKDIFSRFPGRYCVSDIECNTAAVNFWRGLAKQYDPDSVEESFIAPGEEKFLCQIFSVPSN